MNILEYGPTHQCAVAFGDLGWESLPYFLLLECIYNEAGRDLDLIRLYQQAYELDGFRPHRKLDFALMRRIALPYDVSVLFGFSTEIIEIIENSIMAEFL